MTLLIVNTKYNNTFYKRVKNLDYEKENDYEQGKKKEEIKVFHEIVIMILRDFHWQIAINVY